MWRRISHDAQAEVQAAFRAGLLDDAAGFAGDDRDDAAAGLHEDLDVPGEGEFVVLATQRLAGLNEPRAAFETGRALRLIAQLFDKAGAPARVTEQFRDNLAAAVMTEHMRDRRGVWRVDDTIEMFLEMYRRFAALDDRDLDAIRAFLLERVRRPRPPRRRGGQAAAPFRFAA